jgi:hypothetical protein
MQKKLTFNSVLEAISSLPIEDQYLISEIIRSRVVEERRKLIAKDILVSKVEYNSGKTGSGSVNDFLNEIDSEK